MFNKCWNPAFVIAIFLFHRAFFSICSPEWDPSMPWVLSALWRGGRWKGTFSSPFHLPNRTRTFPREFPPSFVAYFASRRDVNFNFAGLRALSQTPTLRPTGRAQYIRGRDCRRYCDIYWKTCKGAKYKYRLMVRDHAFSPAPKRTNAYWGRCRANIFPPSMKCIKDEKCCYL